jgi:hypothetical protein
MMDFHSIHFSLKANRCKGRKVSLADLGLKITPLFVNIQIPYLGSDESGRFHREDRMVIMGKPDRKVEEALIQEGWKTLVKKMGVARATRFLVAFERGEGDSVKEIKRFWRGKSLDEIYHMVKREKITP